MIIALQIVETWRPLETVEIHALQLLLRSTSVLFSSIITKRDDYKTKVKQRKVQGYHRDSMTTCTQSPMRMGDQKASTWTFNSEQFKPGPVNIF